MTTVRLKLIAALLALAAGAGACLVAATLLRDALG
jgi:hypothetical protein